MKVQTDLDLKRISLGVVIGRKEISIAIVVLIINIKF